MVEGEWISKWFKAMLDGFRWNETVEQIWNEVSNRINKEFNIFVDYLNKLKWLTERQLEDINRFKNKIEDIKIRIKREFLESLERRIKSKEINQDYADNIRWLTDKIDMYVKNMDTELKKSIKNWDSSLYNIKLIFTKN